MDFFLGGEGSLRPANAVVAIIVVDETSYLMQLRDQKPNIFYPGHWGLFTNFTFDYGSHGTVFRRFYEVSILGRALKKLSLHEGSEMRAFLPAELLNLPRVVPYDSFAVWLHASGSLQAHRI